ncbi:asparagine synthetase B family protein [Methylomonas rapida]|uniref:asparagine synthase (glutamine-hydrolyzing) n=1 Tax=Methylomonas rapida TaxID=2963939 RepID=A0ABY7GNX0_9GAMM|nr:asparagine synthase C-terminal domain-containing protein [Methylomonas rapida]WAR46174.1 asparagine synthase C-terminal domain-containing protein [Methylomonas rapida]
MTNFAGWMGSQRPQRQIASMLTDMMAGQTGCQVAVGAQFGLAAKHFSASEGRRLLLVALKTGLTNERQRQLLAAYDRHGLEFLEREKQPEALILIDSERQSVMMATDPIGLCNLYYARTADGLVFGSSADFVVRHADVDDEISPQSVYDYVYYHHCPSPNTIYQAVKKLEGGQCLIWQNGQLSLKYYWQPTFQESASINLKQAGAELQALIIDAVNVMAESAEQTGAFLSGGLDSSTVAGALAKVYPGQAKTFSIGFPVEGYNEIEYANIAVKHFNTRQHEYYVTPEDTVNAVSLIAAYYDEPFGNSSALAAYYCAKLAKDNGIKRLLGGDGGDEIFAGNERYAKQMLFEHYHRLPGFAKVALESGLNHLPAVLAKQKIPFKARRYIEQANTLMPDRLQDYNFLHRHDVADIFQDDFLTRIDTAEPLRLLKESYWRPEQASTLNRMLYMDWKTTLHDNDLVKVNRMCELAGVEVGYPLLDQRIVDLSCKIPSASKLQGQKLRWFYKQAMADFLPEPIINKSKHGFGLPFGVWLKDHQPLKELAYDAIHGLKKREYFKPAFLDHAIDMHQSIHAAYYGELIWILMMLELWFVGKGR